MTEPQVIESQSLTEEELLERFPNLREELAALEARESACEHDWTGGRFRQCRGCGMNKWPVTA